MAAAAALLLRGLPLRRARAPSAVLSRWRYAVGCSTTNAYQSPDAAVPASERSPSTCSSAKGPPYPSPSTSWMDQPEYRRWKDKEAEILKDIEPITFLTKDILHSGRYMDGERLNDEDEKAVVQKLLAYHPHSEDKIGSGLDSIMNFVSGDQTTGSNRRVF